MKVKTYSRIESFLGFLDSFLLLHDSSSRFRLVCPGSFECFLVLTSFVTVSFEFLVLFNDGIRITDHSFLDVEQLEENTLKDEIVLN